MTGEILSEGKVDFDAFVDALRSRAVKAQAHTSHVKLPDFPEAVAILARSDDDFQDDYNRSGGTQFGLEQMLAELEERLITHIRDSKLQQMFPDMFKAAT